MELVIISDKKMKIMLTQKELDRYNIDSESFSITNDAHRHAFRRLLNDACKQSGFENNAARLMVQMYPAKKGGCEIFVTKMESSEAPSKRPSSPSPISLDIECYETSDDAACYCFDTFSHLNSVCRQLVTSRFKGKSDAYVSTSGTYYLILSKFHSKRSIGQPYNNLSFINEFTVSSGLGSIPYVQEYCKLICKDKAVDVLGML